MTTQKPSCDSAIRDLMKTRKDETPWVDDDNYVPQTGGGPLPPLPEGLIPSGGQTVAWQRSMYWWGRKVRRDILVLEHHLNKLSGGKLSKNREFYGDPGDPPPPPE